MKLRVGWQCCVLYLCVFAPATIAYASNWRARVSRVCSADCRIRLLKTSIMTASLTIGLLQLFHGGIFMPAQSLSTVDTWGYQKYLLAMGACGVYLRLAAQDIYSVVPQLLSLYQDTGSLMMTSAAGGSLIIGSWATDTVTAALALRACGGAVLLGAPVWYGAKEWYSLRRATIAQNEQSDDEDEPSIHDEVGAVYL